MRSTQRAQQVAVIHYHCVMIIKGVSPPKYSLKVMS